MPAPLPIADAARVIAADPAPVLLVDTCSLLDVIRAPQRSEIRNEVMEAATSLHQRAVALSRQLWIVMAPFVLKEWRDHADSTEEGLRAHIARIDDHIAALNVAVRSALSGSTLSTPLFSPLLLPANLRQRAQILLDVALVLEEDQACIMQARRRVAQDVPPASRGKSEFKDCEIVEHYLALCRQLRINGFSQTCVFVSSNKKDYCEEPTSRLLPELQADFGAVSLQYAGDFAWASGIL